MKIGTVFDVDIYINKLLVAMIAIWVVIGNGLEIAPISLAVFLHELGHIVTARLCGLQVKEIELYPFGGAIRIESILELNPSQEIAVSLAGPLANIMVATIYVALDSRLLVPSYESFIRANLMLACFNILPALPLDGGRAARAILSKEIGIERATRIMSIGGIVLSIFLITSGIYAILNGVFNITVFFMAGFLIYSAIREKKTAAYLMLRDITDKKDTLLKKGSMEIRYIAVVDDTPLAQIVKNFTPYRYHYVNIVDYRMEKIGCISESQIIEGMLEFNSNIAVGKLLVRLEGKAAE